MKLRIAAVASVALLALAGCGKSDFQEDIEDVIDYQLTDDDVDNICEVYHEDGWDSFEETFRAIYDEHGGYDWNSSEAQDVIEDTCD